MYQLLKSVAPSYLHKQLAKSSFFQRNLDFEKAIKASALRAAAIPDTQISLPKKPGSLAYVTSNSDVEVMYTILAPGTAEATCNCVSGSRGNLCKHVIKVNSPFYSLAMHTRALGV